MYLDFSAVDFCNLGLVFLVMVFSLLSTNVFEIDDRLITVASIPPFMDCYVHHELIKPNGCIFILIDGRLFSRWNGAWCCCWCCCGCCGQPLCIPAPPLPSPPLPRTNRNGFFQANLSLSPRRWRQPKCESRGGEKEGFIHCLPLQCGGCCSGATPGRPFQSFSVRFSQARREDRCFCEGEWVSGFIREYVIWGSVFRCSRRSGLDVCSPCGYKRAITVRAEVT